MLFAMGQCYLPGKMADNMHSHTKKITVASCPVSVLFLPQLGEKMPWFSPFINKVPLPLTRHHVWRSVIYLYFIFTIFLLTEQMWQPSKDVSLIIKGKIVSGKCQCFFEETFPRVITIFQTVQL